MAIEHARICGACGKDSPSWADRCPVCGSLSLVHRVTIVPAAAPIATLSPKAGRKKARRAMVGREPPHTSPARSTA
jgi:predicted ATP-dependent serine protease